MQFAVSYIMILSMEQTEDHYDIFCDVLIFVLKLGRVDAGQESPRKLRSKKKKDTDDLTRNVCNGVGGSEKGEGRGSWGWRGWGRGG